MVRVLEIIPSLKIGGAERALGQRLAYQPLEFSSAVVTCAPGDAELEAKVVKGAELLRLRGYPTSNQVAAIVRESEADVLVAHSPRLAVQCLGSNAVTNQVPIVVMAHNSICSDRRLLRPLWGAALATVNSRAALHIAVSKAAAQGPWCRSARRVVVCPLGSEVDFSESQVAPHPWPEDTAIRLLAMSRLTPAKNLAALLKAINGMRSALSSKGVHVAIVGSGPMASSLRRIQRRLHLSELVSLFPETSSPGAMLRAADTLIVCSTAEGGPLTIYEALLSGTKVVSTPVGIAPDIAGSNPDVWLSKGCRATDLRDLVRIAVEVGQTSESERGRTREAAGNYLALRCSTRIYEELREIANSSRGVPR